MPFESKNYDSLLGIQGFSDVLLKNHFTLYQGYVTNTNKLADVLTAMVKEGKQAMPEFAELKRRFGWEFNGMRLHELYFDNLDKSGKPIPDSLKTSKTALDVLYELSVRRKDEQFSRCSRTTCICLGA